MRNVSIDVSSYGCHSAQCAQRACDIIESRTVRQGERNSLLQSPSVEHLPTGDVQPYLSRFPQEAQERLVAQKRRELAEKASKTEE